jgi:hypothetical protein
LIQEGIELYLLSTRSGVVKDIVGLNFIRSLPSCKRVDMFTQPGGFVVPTVDYHSRVGTVVLANTDVAQLIEDCNTIRKWEVENKIIEYL